MSNKVYDFKASQEVIREAWSKAVEHLKNTLGDQYDCNVTEDVLPNFFDKVEQDITFKMTCPSCGQVDDEGNFSRSISDRKLWICYECYTVEEESKT